MKRRKEISPPEEKKIRDLIPLPLPFPTTTHTTKKKNKRIFMTRQPGIHIHGTIYLGSMICSVVEMHVFIQ
jgi:hypothetical protein